MGGILHVDLDAFFAAVEERDDPRLRGKPILVGGKSSRAVVSTASYEARKFGCKSAMPMGHALRLCPHAIVVSPRYREYAAASAIFMEVLREHSPDVEPLSLDEAFVDVRSVRRLMGPPLAIAQSIKERVGARLGLVASVGAAPNKFAAKIASDIDKPDGLVIVEEHELLKFLHPLPIERLWGIGAKTGTRLHELGLHTIGAVAGYPKEILEHKFGPALGARLATLSQGIDPRSVKPRSAAKSIGHEQTFATDVVSEEELGDVLVDQAERVASRVRFAKHMGQTLTLKLRYADFQTLTRQTRLLPPSDDGVEFAQAARKLLRNEFAQRSHAKRVRLIGLSVSGFDAEQEISQLTLEFKGPNNDENPKSIGPTLDRIANKFGADKIVRAVAAKKSSKLRSE